MIVSNIRNINTNVGTKSRSFSTIWTKGPGDQGTKEAQSTRMEENRRGEGFQHSSVNWTGGSKHHDSRRAVSTISCARAFPDRHPLRVSQSTDYDGGPTPGHACKHWGLAGMKCVRTSRWPATPRLISSLDIYSGYRRVDWRVACGFTSRAQSGCSKTCRRGWRQDPHPERRLPFFSAIFPPSPLEEAHGDKHVQLRRAGKLPLDI